MRNWSMAGGSHREVHEALVHSSPILSCSNPFLPITLAVPGPGDIDDPTLDQWSKDVRLSDLSRPLRSCFAPSIGKKLLIDAVVINQDGQCRELLVKQASVVVLIGSTARSFIQCIQQETVDVSAYESIYDEAPTSTTEPIFGNKLGRLNLHRHAPGPSVLIRRGTV